MQPSQQNLARAPSAGSNSGSQGRHLQSARSTGLHFPHIPCAQIYRRLETYFRFKFSKFIHQDSQISNDKSCLSSRPTVSPRLDGVPGLTGRLSAHSHTTNSPQIPSLPDGNPALVFQSSALWSFTSPSSILQNSQVPPFSPPNQRNASSRLSGRLGVLGSNKGSSQPQPDRSLLLPSKSGLADKFPKVEPSPFNRLSLVRSSLASPSGSLGHPSRQNSLCNERNSLSSPSSVSFTAPVGSTSWQAGVHLPNSPPFAASPPTPLCASMLLQGQLQGQSGSSAKVTSQSPASMDDKRSAQLHPCLPFQCTTPGIMDRRIQSGLGRAHSLPPSFGEVDARGSLDAHQPSGGSSCTLLDRSSLPFKVQGSPFHRQSSSPLCPKQTPLSIPKLTSRNKSPAASTSDSFPNHPSSENILKSKHPSGCPEQTAISPDGIVPAGQCLSSNPGMAQRQGSPRNRPDGDVCERPSPSFLLSIAGARGPSSKCPSPGLDTMENNISLSSSLADSPCNAEARDLPGPRNPNPPLDPSRAVVHEDSEESIPLASPELLRDSQFWTRKLRSLDRLQFLRLVLGHLHGDDVADHLITAHRASTHRQAQSVWRKFQQWLPTTVSSVTRDTVLRFLIFLHSDLQLSARTVVNYRATLALPLRSAFGIDFEHESFSLLTRSQFLQKPPATKKIPAWSLNVVLEAFSSFRFSEANLSQQDLFFKTIFLVALASGNRASELAAIVRTGISLHQDMVSLPVRPSFLFKNQSLDRPNPPSISFPTLGERHTLCPWNSLRLYLRQTSPPQGSDALFLHPKTNLPLTAGRLSYWLTKSILAADVTATRAAGHDIRKIAFSVAFTRGKTLKEIIESAFWHSPHVFIRKYLCSLDSPNYACVAGRST